MWSHDINIITSFTNGMQALVNTVMNLQVPYKAGNFLTSRVTISYSRRAQLHGVS